MGDFLPQAAVDNIRRKTNLATKKQGFDGIKQSTHGS